MGEKKGRCKRRMVRFGKAAALFLGSTLGPIVPQAVAAIEVLKQSLPDVFDGHEKRRVVFKTVALNAKDIGHAAWDELKQGLTTEAESYVRAAIEAALFNLRQGHALAELEDWATDESLQDSDED